MSDGSQTGPDAASVAQNKSEALPCLPGFALLFSSPLLPGFKGFANPPDGFVRAPDSARAAMSEWRGVAQAHVLGAPFVESARLAWNSLGRIDLGMAASGEPRHADVALLTHVAGVALWSVWLPAPRQPFDVAAWVNDLDPDRTESVAARIWRRLSGLNQSIAGKSDFDSYLPLSVIRLPDADLGAWLPEHAERLVSLLWRDRLGRPLKPDVVSTELSQDTCVRVGGITLVGRRSALDLHDRRDASVAEAEAMQLPPRSALPFLVTLELLCIERAVLQGLYGRLAYATPRSIDDLLTLKRDVMDGLEEYYGTTLASTRFNDVVAAVGEDALGIVGLFDAVTDRMDMVSFTLTTGYQQRMTLLQFWLTVVFGATEIGFIAATIATWYHRTGLGAVLAWTVGATVISALTLAALLRNKLAP